MQQSATFVLLFVTVFAAAVNGEIYNETWGQPSSNHSMQGHNATWVKPVEYRQGYNVTWGKAMPNQYILRQDVVEMDFRFFRVVSTDYNFNQTCVLHPRNITQIKVTDLYRKDGGNVTLLSGGPRYTYAKLHFKSQRDHGFKFLVTIFY